MRWDQLPWKKSVFQGGMHASQEAIKAPLRVTQRPMPAWVPCTAVSLALTLRLACTNHSQPVVSAAGMRQPCQSFCCSTPLCPSHCAPYSATACALQGPRSAECGLRR